MLEGLPTQSYSNGPKSVIDHILVITHRDNLRDVSKVFVTDDDHMYNVSNHKPIACAYDNMTDSNPFSNSATINEFACEKVAWSKAKTSDALIDYSFALSQNLLISIINHKYQ